MARVAVGTGVYGKCDQVQNVGYVAHYFFHLGYSPLIPLKSVFVLERDESQIKLPFSFKAMFFGYLRAFLVWCMGIAGLVALFALAGKNTQLNLPNGPVMLTPSVGYGAIGASIALLAVLILSYFVARPSAARREQLVNHLRQAGLKV